MYKLTITSILWAFSFSLIGEFLSGRVDSYLAVTIRFALASIVLSPFLRIKELSVTFIFKMLGIGAIQIGLMYLAFYNSFNYLKVPEVILFTVFTPIYISFISDLLDRKFNPTFFFSALIAVIGAIVLKWNNISENFFIGFLLVQIANICFAIGQVLYVKVTTQGDIKINDKEVFALFYYGALIISLPATIIFGNLEKTPSTSEQYFVLVWLGVVASGVGYILWNSGARTVSSGVLAVMNNLVIPLGIIVNILLWGKETNSIQLILGTLIILIALFMSLLKKENIWKQDLQS